MSEPVIHPLESILRLCAAADPNPWYPSVYARENGILRDSLDPSLDELRMGALIRLTDWVKGHGQGYVLTPEGKEVLASPKLLGQLRAGTLRLAPPAPSVEPTRDLIHHDRGEAVREALLFDRKPFVSRGLLMVNVLVFVAGALLGQQQGIPLNRYLAGPTDVLESIGAMSSLQIVQGQWWRLLTNCFVHMGFLHLAMNMYTLHVIGPVAERMWGPVRLFILYILAGIAGSSLALAANPRIMLAGASGALCGIIAAVAAWVYLNRLYIPGQLYAAWRGQLIQTFFLVVFISLFPGVSGMAHLGGGGGGLVVGVMLHLQRFGLGWQRLAAALGVLLVPVLCVGLIVQNMKTDDYWQNLDLRVNYLPRAEAALRAGLAIYNQQARMPTPKEINSELLQQRKNAILEAQAKITEASEILEKAGPYRDPAIERERERFIREIKTKQKFLEANALQEFYFPIVKELEKSALAVYDKQASPLAGQAPQDRDPKKVQETLSALRAAQAKLAEAIDILGQAGPFLDPEVETERKEYIQAFQKNQELFAKVARALMEGKVYMK